MLTSISGDLAFGWRLLVRQPARTCVLVLTLALGIGANTALFTIVDTVVLRPLPYPEPERLMRLWDRNERGGLLSFSVSVPHYEAWRGRTRSFEAIGAYREDGFTFMRTSGPAAIDGARATASLFDVLGVRPALGRAFRADEDVPGGPPVAVVTYDFWRRELNADPTIVGRTVPINSEAHVIVGVMPAGFRFPQQERVEVLIPYRLINNPAGRGAHFLRVLARLRRGSTQERAHAELNALARTLESELPDENRGWTVTSLPLHEAVVGGVRDTLIRLQGACLLVLLIATVNVANLLIVRASGRSREMAVRAALGAGAARLIRQLLTESLLLAALGSAAGLALAYGLLAIAPDWLPTSIPRARDLSMDARVVLFAIGMSLATGVLFGIAPAIGPVLRSNVLATLGATRSTTAAHGYVLRRVLVALQLGLALMLLAGAALLVQSATRLARVDRGFVSSGVLSFELKPPLATYRTPEQRARLYRRIEESLAGLPGVTAVSFTHRLPLSGNSVAPLVIVGRPPQSEPPQIAFRSVSNRYWQALGIALIRGRIFTDAETWERRGAAVINQAAARRYWPHEDPIGQRINAGPNADEVEIVGIVADNRDASLSGPAEPMLFIPYVAAPMPAMTVVVRVAGEPGTLSASAARAVAAVDPQLPIAHVQTLTHFMDEVLAQPRFNSMLASLFAGLALVLAAVGVYGVIAWLVASRTREIGIRLALGARPGQIVRLVLGEGVRLAIGGVALGIGAALLLGRVLADLLYDVTPRDPATLVATSATLLAIALVATILPARRALRIDPIRTLRDE